MWVKDARGLSGCNGTGSKSSSVLFLLSSRLSHSECARVVEEAKGNVAGGDLFISERTCRRQAKEDSKMRM